MNKKNLITSKGLERLKKRLDNFKNTKRPKTVKRLSIARSHGDLSENSDYANAKEELSFIDGRIEELEKVLNNAEVIKQSNSSQVSLGSQITVQINNNEQVYELVGEWESNPMEKKISYTSPLGKALIGKKEGDEVEIEAPAGKVKYKINKIK